MDGSSSSRVTVEYHDPAGVFPLVSAQLQARLPLRKLNWKSPTRPLRSIDSLHIKFVPDQEGLVQEGVRPANDAFQASSSITENVQQTQPSSQGPADSADASTEVSQGALKGRRHQIPGLRQTPYLKVYLLRCDDPEIYKASSRKLLREWVRTHTPPSQSTTSANAQENHDAFEWLIVHVVVPDTPAASQSRWSKPSRDRDASDTMSEKPSNTSRWPGRSSSTIFEKIRSDFNVSSKSAPDRVAQIRVQKNDVPPHLLPAGSGGVSSPYSESPQEVENALNDLVLKFKSLILTSFDLRVRQYEEDIREKDAQRALPGWNFCTFFILKEGLARGFESVGLIEDALVGYDELSVGLDSVIRDQAGDGLSDHGGSFLTYTEDLQQCLSDIAGISTNHEPGTAVEAGTDENLTSILVNRPVNATRKNYRDLILSSSISIYDFKSYVFARQISLLLRLGNARSFRPKPSVKTHKKSDSYYGIEAAPDQEPTSSKPPEKSEDPVWLAEVCQRALSFITSVARILREDLRTGARSNDLSVSDGMIENLVSSWTFAVAQQVLEETDITALPTARLADTPKSSSSSRASSRGRQGAEFKFPMSDSNILAHHRRTSSLQSNRSPMREPPWAQASHSSQVVYEQRSPSKSRQQYEQGRSNDNRTGIEGLAAHRAELLLVQRRILERIGNARGWSIGWTPAANAHLFDSTSLTEIDLDDPKSSVGEVEIPDSMAQEGSSKDSTLQGLYHPSLIAAISSIDDFRNLYEKLSDSAIKHYLAAGRTRSAERVMGDLAVVKFELGDYAGAAMYFSRLTPLYADQRWNFVETSMVKMHAQCLKRLQRKDDYVKVLLHLLAKSAAHKRSSLLPRVKYPSALTPESDLRKGDLTWLNDDLVNTEGFLTELVTYSDQLSHDISVPISQYFDNVILEPYLRHYPDKDGFQLRLCIRHLLEDDLDVDHVMVRLLSESGGQSGEIWLEHEGPLRLSQGITKIWLDTNVTTYGLFVVDQILIQANKIKFVQELSVKKEPPNPLVPLSRTSTPSLPTAKQSRIMCYPRVESFDGKAKLCRSIQIDRPGSIEIECKSGWNEIQKAELRVRAASAGLRLRTADTVVTEGEITIRDQTWPGVIDFTDMTRDRTATFRVPYELESHMRAISVRLEITYHTEAGEFRYLAHADIPIELPLDVNVHDLFKEHALFSRFNIRPSGRIPLHVLNVELEESEDFDVQPPSGKLTPMLVFPKHPACLTYRITRVDRSGDEKRVQRRPLSLVVDYRCLDEGVLDVAVRAFTSDIRESSVAQLERLLTPLLINRLRQRIKPDEYERIALMSQVSLGTFNDSDWIDVLESLPSNIQKNTRNWLEYWYKTNTILTLQPLTTPQLDSPPTIHRRVTITVTIPRIQTVHTASLAILSPSSFTTPTPVGTMLAAKLRISHTRQWGDNNNAPSTVTNPKLDFVYELDARPDTWLIGGQRRAHFSAAENEQLTFPVMLLPLRPGHLLLPSVEIRYVPVRKDGAEAGAEGEGVVTCETDYQSLGETVLVIPNVRSTTVALGKMGQGGTGAVLVDAEARETGVVGEVV